MVETPGYCSLKYACSIAASGRPVMVPLASPFICPECGGTLTAPALDDIAPLARRPIFLVPVLAALALLVASAVLAKVGYFTRPVPPPAAPPALVSLPANLLQATAPVSIQEPVVSPPPVVIAATEPAPLPRTHRDAARQGTGDRPEMGEKAVHVRHHVNVHLSVSMPLISGGEPDYPEQYQDGESGTVMVGCKLRLDGSTHSCTTIRRSGGPIFDVAVHSWLDLKDVQFKPTRLRGRFIDHVTLTVDFIGQPAQP